MCWKDWGLPYVGMRGMDKLADAASTPLPSSTKCMHSARTSHKHSPQMQLGFAFCSVQSRKFQRGHFYSISDENETLSDISPFT